MSRLAGLGENRGGRTQLALRPPVVSLVVAEMEHTGLVLGQPGSLAVHTARERTRLASLRLPLDTSTLLLDWPPTLRHRLAAHGWSIPDEVEDEERVAGLEAALLREGFDPFVLSSSLSPLYADFRAPCSALEPFQLALLPKVDSPCDNPEARTTALTLLQDPSTPFASLSSFLPHLTLVVLSGRSRLRILLKHVDKQLTAISALESIPKRDEAEEEELKELRLRRLTWFWGEVFDESAFSSSLSHVCLVLTLFTADVWESAPLYHHLVITANLPPFKPPPSRPYTFASFITGHYRSRDLSLYRASPLLLNGPKAWGVFRGRVVAGTAARVRFSPALSSIDTNSFQLPRL